MKANLLYVTDMKRLVIVPLALQNVPLTFYQKTWEVRLLLDFA